MTWVFDLLEDNEKIAYDFRINGEFAGYTADGMSIDRDGLLWIGLFKGNSIVAVDPEWVFAIQTLLLAECSFLLR